jgi:hypothetical protein
MKLALLITGTSLEVLGLALTAWPEWFPRASRVARDMLRGIGRLAGWVKSRTRRLLRRPQHVVVTASPAELRLSGGRAYGYVSVSEDASDERKLDFLLRQAQQTQEKFYAVDDRITALDAQLRGEIGLTRAALEARIAEELDRARNQFIGRRILGLLCIATGSVVLAFVNVV